MVRFFIVGTGRCGTQLLRYILNLHPEVYVPGESHWIPAQYEAFGLLRNAPEVYSDIVKRTYYQSGERTIDRISEEIGSTTGEFLELVESRLRGVDPTIVEFNNELFRAAGASAGRTILGDKTPDYGPYLNLLRSLWPAAKFIHMIRDGRDAAVSMSGHAGYQRLLSCRVHSWAPLSLDKRYQLTYGSDPDHRMEDYLELWVMRVRRILDEASRLPPGCYLEVRYEDLLQDSRRTLRAIMDFLGIESPEGWRGAAIQSIRSPIAGESRPAGREIALSSIAKETLKSLGYDIQFA